MTQRRVTTFAHKSTCIFCRKDSSSSKSREHVIPESLGNTKQVLPRGIVCDNCNNYFARKIEGPLLTNDAIEFSRFVHTIPNKRGIVPQRTGVLSGSNAPIRITHDRPDLLRIHLPPKYLIGNELSDLWKKQRLQFYTDVHTGPDALIVSRFLAKVGLEYLALKLHNYPGWDTDVVLRPELDELRTFARFGIPAKVWPFSKRTIYPSDMLFEDPHEVFEILHEIDTLYTDTNELYVVVVIHGVEYAINCGGPVIEGYYKWLFQHDYISPLYKDAQSYRASNRRQSVFATFCIED